MSRRHSKNRKGQIPLNGQTKHPSSPSLPSQDSGAGAAVLTTDPPEPADGGIDVDEMLSALQVTLQSADPGQGAAVPEGFTSAAAQQVRQDEPYRNADAGESQKIEAATHQGSSTDSSSDQFPGVTGGAQIILTELENQGRRQRAGFRKDLTEFYSQLRGEFRRSVSELKSAESDRAAIHSDALQSLSATVSAALEARQTDESAADGLEHLLSGLESRLLARIDAVEGLIKSSGSTVTGETTVIEPVIADRPESPVEHKSPRLPVKPGSGVRSWEEIRNEMLAAGVEFESPSIENRPAPVVAPPVENRLPEVAQLTSDRHFKLPEQDPALELPSVVDPDRMTLSELRDAFCEREVFISTLLARIRRQQESATSQLSPEQLRELAGSLPEELAAQVRHTLRQLNDLARVGELELSLERARIARQVNQLEHSRHIIERNARELGLELNADGSLSNPSGHSHRGSSSRRWLGKLGFGQ